MNLTDLVPPIELCKLIPVGGFDDSALGHHRYCIKDGKEYYEVVQRGNTHSFTDVQYPAPTLEEIIRKIRLDLLCGLEHHGDFYVANRHIGWLEDERAATAAIKFYFKLKGIEYNTGVK